MQATAATKKALVAGIMLMCCALVVLTIVSNGKPQRVELATKVPVPEAWDAHWNWFTQTHASSHMFADGANEMFPAQGTYPFDQGHPNLGNYGA